MPDHPNLTIMKNTLAAFRSGDIPALSRLLAEDVVWRLPGQSFLARDYRGQEEVFAFFGRLMEETKGTFKVESLAMVAGDDGGVFLDRLTAERNGKKLDVRLALHVTIRNGKIVEGVDHFHHEHRWDAFWDAGGQAS